MSHYRFGPAEVRPAERQLVIDGAAAAVGARAFDLLLTLIERRDRVVDKTELFDIVWPGLVVEENNLHVQVSSLRKLLGPNVIATVPGRGYQFVAPLATTDFAVEDDRSDAPAHPNNLPLARTRFIGREKALADCAQLLRDTRLLTLSGIGGCGKTRLAQELAHRQLDAFPDGVWFVDLGPLQEAQRVSATVAATLGVQVGQLADHLRSRRAMVVLDNCEHVVGAAVASIESLLGSCAALKIVVTSREVLGMSGEQVFAVRSLSLPATSDLDEIRASEAVRLFVDHARLVVPEFEVDVDNAAAIADICRRLDGIALAIELAAARVRVLSLEDIRARLSDRFRLLTGGNRALPRHQTLHATMQWSHDLLTPQQQQLFRRLAAFSGGCTLAAATRVAGEDADEYEVLEQLTALHDKSLLVVDRDTQAQPRYRMLETVRQYAEERLNEAGEGDDVRNRHLLHYVALAEAAAPHWRGPRQGEWYAAFRAEQHNLVAAHAWCEHAPRGGELALRLAGASWRHWTYAMQSDRGYRLAAAALELGRGEPESAHRARVLYGMAWHAMKMGRYDESLACAQRFLSIARRLPDRGLLADALTMMGVAHDTTGQGDKAPEYYREACELARADGDRMRLAAALCGLAELRRAAHDWADAEALYRDALQQESCGDNPRGYAISLCNLACVFIATQRNREAREALCQARARARAIGHKGMVEGATDVVAVLASSLDDHAAAARFHGAMLRQMEEAGFRHEPVDEAFFAPWIARSRAALGDAAFDAAQASGWALSHVAALAELDRWLDDASAAA